MQTLLSSISLKLRVSVYDDVAVGQDSYRTRTSEPLDTRTHGELNPGQVNPGQMRGYPKVNCICQSQQDTLCQKTHNSIVTMTVVILRIIGRHL
jgi:hypothetical protein